MYRQEEEKPWPALTLGLQVARFCLLHPAFTCGKPGVLLLPSEKGRRAAAFFRKREERPKERSLFLFAGIAGRKHQLEIPYLRAMSMTDNERARPAIPYQSTRHLSCCSWFFLSRKSSSL
jgi:hypothetical protein